jgi:putative transposase
MARNREFLTIPDVIVHVYNRGVDRRELFHRPRDYESFMELSMLAQKEVSISILAHTLMPNHFHMVLHQHVPYAISQFMYKVCRPYSLRVNKRLRRSGPLFDGRYKATVIDDACGLLRVSRYIHMNPVEARLVQTAEEWLYSSCRSCINGREESLVDHSILWALAGGASQYAQFLKESNPGDPVSPEGYLCSDAAEIWAEKGKIRLRCKEV